MLVGSFKPGVVDTSLQGTIRESAESSMPIVQNFRTMKAKADEQNDRGSPTSVGARPPPKGALDTPENVACFAEYLLVGTTNEEFTNAKDDNEHDIRDATKFERWVDPSNLPA